MSFKKILAALALPALALFLGTLTPASVAAKAVEGVVNINTATPQELTMLPGIGKAKAEQIVQLRQSKPFASVDDLKNVPGLGAKRIEAMRPHVVTEGATTAKRVSAKKAAAASPAAAAPAPATPQS
ncbi:MAG: helix-hairpin-helix domain-containing protein [Deltaproteobacteria bacterium]|nr:helix-hairpin-helix domain-containing protein [Deltaproteobacteria bacterium]